MYSLGINTFHVDAAVCLLRDGKLVAAIAEERLGRRRKHFAGFPAQAVRRVLDIAGIGMCDVLQNSVCCSKSVGGRPVVGRVFVYPSLGEPSSSSR